MENLSTGNQINHSGIPPKSWLVESILVTIFCCQILGIISIIYSASVESKFYRGDIAGAESASRTAKTLVMVSVGVGLLAIVGFMAFGGMAIIAGVMNN